MNSKIIQLGLVAGLVMLTTHCDFLRPQGKTQLPEEAQTVSVPAGWFVFGGVSKCGFNFASATCPDSLSGQFPWRLSYLSAYEIDAHEVTNAEYLKCIQDGACEYWSSCYTDTPLATEMLSELSTKLCPYVRDEVALEPTREVSWKQARAYCQWRYAEQNGDLPTEAQWERAAVGGIPDTHAQFSQVPLPLAADKLPDDAPGCQDFVMQVSTDERNSCTVDSAWPQDRNPVYGDDDNHPFACYKYADGWGYNSDSTPARAATRSPTGAYDMAGNVAEWVLDAYSPLCDAHQDLLGNSANVLQDCESNFAADFCISQRHDNLSDLSDPSQFKSICNPVRGQDGDLNVERVVKGGHYASRDWCELSPRARASRRPLDTDKTLGFRCAFWQQSASARDEECANLVQ